MRKRSQFSVEKYIEMDDMVGEMVSLVDVVTENVVGVYGKTGKLAKAVNKAQKAFRELQTLFAQECALVTPTGDTSGDTAGVDGKAV